MKKLNIQPEAWSPLAEGKNNIFTNPILKKIADNHNKTTAQVILGWNIQRGVIIITKSVHKNRMEENLNIWDFSLTEEETNEISTLDIGHSEIIDHSLASTAKWLNT